MKLGLNYMPDVWYAAVRLLISTAIIVTWMLCRKTLKRPSIKDLPMIFSQGFLQLGVYMTLVLVSLHLVGASKTVILSYTIVLWTTPIAIIFFKEHCSNKKLLGLLLGLLGIIIYFNPLTLNWHNKHFLLGSACALFAAICWSIAILHARYGQWHSKPSALYPWQMLAAAIPITITAYILSPHPTVIWQENLYITLTYSTLFATIFAWWAMTVVSKNLDSSTTAIGLLTVPMLAIILSVSILHETLSRDMTLALVCITLGVFLVITSHRRKVASLSSLQKNQP